MNNNNKPLSIKESSSPRNVVGDLPLTGRGKTERSFSYLTNSTNKGDSRTLRAAKHSGMTATTRAFTLIELLVVVLIIGILTAVAIPQYQKAVAKSQAAQALTMLQSLSQAYKTYHMANGEWSNSLDNLDVTIPWTGTTPWYPDLNFTRSTTDWSVQLHLWGEPQHAELYVGRLTGPYAGSGFAYFFTDWGTKGANLYIYANTLVCVERNGKTNGAIFQKNPGDFCKKVMGSTKRVQTGDVGNFYNMP